MDLTREDVLRCYDQFPFEYHPLWRAVLAGELTREQVLLAETQHFVRSKVGREFRRRAAEEAQLISQAAHSLLMETYKEECTDDEAGPSHLELIRRLLLPGGRTNEEIERAIPTTANAQAIALYGQIAARGPLHHMIGAGAVEYHYSVLSPRIFEAYVSTYGFSEEAAETYKIHGVMDREHAERAFRVLGEPYAQQHSDSILAAVKDAFLATSRHYDGMLEAALGEDVCWTGR